MNATGSWYPTANYALAGVSIGGGGDGQVTRYTTPTNVSGSAKLLMADGTAGTLVPELSSKESINLKLAAGAALDSVLIFATDSNRARIGIDASDSVDKLVFQGAGQWAPTGASLKYNLATTAANDLTLKE